jgi:phosphoribosylformylglycinamidine (FGAM) synthase PurS component
MGRVVIDVMPKPEILDPQGKAVAGALARLGFASPTTSSSVPGRPRRRCCRTR